jgi:hypothetical protein
MDGVELNKVIEEAVTVGADEVTDCVGSCSMGFILWRMGKACQ